MIGICQLKIIKTNNNRSDGWMTCFGVLKQQALLWGQGCSERGVQCDPVCSMRCRSLFKSCFIDVMIEKGVADEQKIWILRDANLFKFLVVWQPVTPLNQRTIQ